MGGFSMKRYLAMLLIVCMSITLVAGCGQGKTGSGSETPAAQKDGAETSGAANSTQAKGGTEVRGTEDGDSVTGSDEQITLEFFNMKPEIVDILDELFALYMTDHPNIKVEVVSPSDAATVLTTRVASGDVPDIYTHWPKEESYALVKAGAAMDLSDTGVLDNIAPSVREVWISWLDGKDITGEYCATISFNFSGLWYNKDIFKDAGYDEFPATWDELMTACEKIKANGITPIEISGLQPSEATQQLYICIASAMSDDAYNAFLADCTAGAVDPYSDVYGAELKELGTKIAQLVSNAQTDVLGTDGESASADFAAGKTAMFMNGSWKYPTIMSANSEINCELAPIPGTTAADTKMAAYPGDMGVWLSANLEGSKRDAAIALVQWMASADFAQPFAEKDGSPSCIQGVDYVAEPFEYAYSNFVSNGSYILNTDCNWTAAQIDVVGSAMQQLYSDGDADAFVQNLANALNNN